MTSTPLDAIDAKILQLLQQDATLSVAELADRVGLSPSPCWRRVKRLEEDGVILGRVTLVDPEKLGLGFEVYASVKLQSPTRENLERFEQATARLPEILECVTVTGAADYLLRVVAADIHAYDDFLRDEILSLGLASDVRSSIVIRVAKRSTAAPVPFPATRG
ncbi:MAG: Lrp/AsnC family transcriptional regulator [Hyphomonadaceae bacterium]